MIFASRDLRPPAGTMPDPNKRDWAKMFLREACQPEVISFPF